LSPKVAARLSSLTCLEHLLDNASPGGALPFGAIGSEPPGVDALQRCDLTRTKILLVFAHYKHHIERERPESVEDFRTRLKRRHAEGCVFERARAHATACTTR